MEPTRQTWNDARMDEFAARTGEGFRDIRVEIRETRTELRDVETELRGEIKGLRTEMNGRFAALESKIEQRFNILFGAMATGFVGAVVSHFLG